MKVPDRMHTIANLIDQAHEARVEKPRPHMGASTLGHPCERWLWLSFRWAVQPRFSGRVLRLFRRGQMEEATIVSDLRAIGMDIRSTGSSQSRVDFGCHVSGSIDGIIETGVPDAPAKRHIAEFKTHSRKSFDNLVKNGVEKSKPMHYVQMQIYMAGKEIDRALYFAVCKDDDSIYTERVRLNKELAEKFINRGRRIALEDRMPPPLSTDPSWYECKFCDANDFCHNTNTTKHVNCRTCAHSTPLEDSTWRCERHDENGIPLDFQHVGCDSHALHPDMVQWEMAGGVDEWTPVYIIEGKRVANGEPSDCVFNLADCVFSSAEILANPAACASGDPNIGEIRQQFGRVIG